MTAFKSTLQILFAIVSEIYRSVPLIAMPRGKSKPVITSVKIGLVSARSILETFPSFLIAI